MQPLLFIISILKNSEKTIDYNYLNGDNLISSVLTNNLELICEARKFANLQA